VEAVEKLRGNGIQCWGTSYGLKEMVCGASSHRGAGEVAAQNPTDEAARRARQTSRDTKEKGWECSGARGLNEDERGRRCAGAAPF
jgi:hypothetical protein